MRVLCCSLTSHGFLYPMIGVAQALRRRGHTVAFVSGALATGTLLQAGFENLADPAHNRVCFQTEVWWNELAIALQTRQLEEAISCFQPDLLFGGELTLGPLLVRDRQQIPTALLGSAVYLWPTGMDDAKPLEQQKRSAWRYQEFLSAYNLARSAFNLPRCVALPDDNPLLGDSFLLQSVPAFTQARGALPARVRLVGACLWEPSDCDSALADWLAEAPERPVLYVQQGRTFGHTGFWPQVLEAFAGAPVRVAAEIGQVTDGPRRFPETFFVRDYLVQSQVLRHARAVICGGGSRTVLGAMMHALPLVILPGGAEQRDMAEQCVAAAIGLHLPITASASTIARAVECVRGDVRFAQHLRVLGQAFAQVDGCERAAMELESLIDRDRRSWRVVPNGASMPTFSSRAVS